MAAPSVFFGTSWEDEVAQAPVALRTLSPAWNRRESGAPPITPEPRQRRKSFQYAAHYRADHDYSPFHRQLDASLKHLYSRTNLAAVVQELGWRARVRVTRSNST